MIEPNAAESAEVVNILLVDDRPEGLMALEAVLAQPGYNLVKAESGLEALALVMSQDFAMILLDVQMPGMDGFQTAAAIKASEKFRDIPIIFITAINRDDRYAVQGYESGAVDYLVKPFDPYTLKSKVAVFASLYRKTMAVKRHAEDFRRQAIELNAINKELEAFSYSVSHDLRSPLRSIDGFSQALLDDFSGLLGPEGSGYLERIRSACKRMSDLIDDLLNLSRLSRAPMHFKEVDLSRLAESIAEELRRSEPGRQVEVKIASGLIVQGDERLLRIALENLLNNAWKFTRKAEAALVEFGSTENEGKPIYYVRDNGVGFDMAYANKLFVAFQRLHDAKEFPGTGIGLAIVHRVLRRHEGKIWTESQSDRGATFYFTLSDSAPAAESESNDLRLSLSAGKRGAQP